MFFIALVIFHVLVCVALIVVVLLQSSKGEGLAGTAFGGGGGLGGAVFGGRGAGSFLSKATTVLAILFMVNSIGLAFMSSSRTGNRAAVTTPGQTESVITREAQRAREQAMQQQQQQQQSSDSLLDLQVPAPSGDSQ